MIETKNDTQMHKLYERLIAISKEFEKDKFKKEIVDSITGIVNIRIKNYSKGILVIIKDQKINIHKDYEKEPELNSSIVVFNSSDDLKNFLSDNDTNQAINMYTEGNPAHFAYFNYLLNAIAFNTRKDEFEKKIKADAIRKFDYSTNTGKPERDMRNSRISGRLQADKVDEGVKYLNDPYLSEYTIENFPRLMKFKEDYIHKTPKITAEYGELLTDFYLNSTDKTNNKYYINPETNKPWNPLLRSASAFNYVMKNKKPIIRDGDLLAGTMTPDKICGSVGQPYTIGWKIWGDLKLIDIRENDRFSIEETTKEILHRKVFPFWMDKHVEAIWKTKVDRDSSYLKIFNRNFFTIPWGLVSINPSSPGLDTVIKRGLKGIREDIYAKITEVEKQSDSDDTEDKLANLKAMEKVIIGISEYSEHLKNHINEIRYGIINEKDIKEEDKKQREKEIDEIYKVLCNVPEKPAETLHEAIQTLWIMFIGIGLDSMDDSLSVGRLDQILQPYFEADIKKILADGNKNIEDYIENAIELIGCFFMRLNSHRLAADTQTSEQNSGAPAVSSIVVGGISRDGKDAVNDMTYIILKVAEMLCTDDPDMDARYSDKVNSDTYLKRLCEVNYLTGGSPAIHNDTQVIKGWKENNPDWPIEDLRDWVPCGCVEPVIYGKHLAAPGDLDSCLVVPLEMALNNGRYPSWPDEKLGPETGEVISFKSFDDFLAAFKKQFIFLYENAIKDGSHKILEAQKQAMPSPLFSLLTEGCLDKSKGVLDGAAKYNTAGASLIGLSDVIDSLLAIKHFVFSEKIDENSKNIKFEQLKSAIDDNYDSFEGRKVYKQVRYDAPKFGSNSTEAREMANKILHMVSDYLHDDQPLEIERERRIIRGGKYTSGYRTNSNHVFFGSITGALPSGRRAGEPFTSGLTPSPSASTNIVDNLIDVAALNPAHTENSFSFNVRISFSHLHTHKEKVDIMSDYLKAFFEKGGMQVQLNMVDTETLVDAMANPKKYPDLIVRISGYTGYYTRLNTALQLEIIKRTQFSI